MIKVGDMVKLIRSPCGGCRICTEASSGYFEVLPGEDFTLDLPKSGICWFDTSDCEFELPAVTLENK